MLISGFVDFICLAVSFLLANIINQTITFSDVTSISDFLDFGYVYGSIILTILIFVRLGLYRAVVRFLGGQALKAVLTGILISGALIFGSGQLISKGIGLSVAMNYMFISLVFIGGSRLFVRALVNAKAKKSNHKVLIYGAGASGRQLLLALENSVEFRATAFVDDDPSLNGVMIKDVRVYGPEEIRKAIDQHAISRVLLALPSASRATRAAILSRLEPLGLPVLTIPGMADIVDGKMKIDELQDVKIEDLLGRDPVAPIQSLMVSNITGKVVMVTGAGGSIGSELMSTNFASKS